MERVYVSLPGMTGSREELRPYIHEVFRHFSPDRMLYGSDWPACRLKNGSWKGMLATFTQSCGAIPSPVRASIIGGTAARLYGLSAQEPVASG
jgi:L-fuconolactonase